MARRDGRDAHVPSQVVADLLVVAQFERRGVGEEEVGSRRPVDREPDRRAEIIGP